MPLLAVNISFLIYDFISMVQAKYLQFTHQITLFLIYYYCENAALLVNATFYKGCYE